MKGFVILWLILLLCPFHLFHESALVNLNILLKSFMEYSFFKSEHLAKISILCSNNLMPSNYLRKPRNGMSQRRLPHWTLLEHLSIICLKYYRLHHTLPILFWQDFILNMTLLQKACFENAYYGFAFTRVLLLIV